IARKRPGVTPQQFSPLNQSTRLEWFVTLKNIGVCASSFTLSQYIQGAAIRLRLAEDVKGRREE
ncbi:MAG: hypothetical protein VCB60_01490, partial [Alphaproteobacteria bacterium]